MGKDAIMMREEEMESSVRNMEKCYTGMDSASSGVPKKFSGLKNAGVFDQGINTIGKQLNSLTNSIFNVKNVVNKRSNEMFHIDRKMAQIAQQIEIPQDFVKNDSMMSNDFNSILLEKLDGKTVNEGQGLTDTEGVSDSIIKSTALGDITKDTITKEEVLDASTSINRENVNNITNGNGTREEKIDASTSIKRENVSNINNAQSLNTQNIDERTSLSKGLLENINNMQDLLKQEINNGASISNVILNNINSNNKQSGVEEVNIDLNNAAILGNVFDSNKQNVDINSNMSAQFDKITASLNELNDNIGGDK